MQMIAHATPESSPDAAMATAALHEREIIQKTSAKAAVQPLNSVRNRRSMYCIGPRGRNHETHGPKRLRKIHSRANRNVRASTVIANAPQINGFHVCVAAERIVRALSE
jgi:hypothetical protein